MSFAEKSLLEATVAELHEQMERGELTAVQLTQYYLERIAAIDTSGPKLNSVLALNPDALSVAAELDKKDSPVGPLHGIPVLLKANIETGDQLTTTAGSLALQGHYAKQDAFLVKQLRKAGAIVLGKANLSEWANFRSSRSSSGWSSEGRQTHNPYALDRTPCGSSSGSGASVSANLAVLAVGTETDGSIICPSGINGIVGIKPTIGLVSRNGIIPLAHSQDTAGPMARTVADATIMLAAMVGQDTGDPAMANFPDAIPDYIEAAKPSNLQGLRIGVQRDYAGAGNNPLVEALFEQAIKTLEALGAAIIDPVVLDNHDDLRKHENQVLLYEFKADINAYLESRGHPNGMRNLEDLIVFNDRHSDLVMPYFGQELFLSAAKKGPLTDEKYLDALKQSKEMASNAINNSGVNAIIAPSNGPAWLVDLHNGDNSKIGSSSLAAVAGFPDITVPMGFVHELPVGLSIMGPAFTEDKLIQIAAAFEQATQARKPPKFLERIELP
ncbi:MAG: amidase [Pseudomonadota bacterium]